MNDRTQNSETTLPSIGRHLVFLSLVGVTAIAVIGFTQQRMVVEKVITALLMPVGLVWLGLFVVVYFSAIHGRRFNFLIAFLLWCLFYFASNEIVSSCLMYPLEQPYVSIDPVHGDHYDYVIILGGGTEFPVSQREQLGTSGDRIAVVAQMYHARKLDRIVATGSQMRPLADGQPNTAEVSRTLLKRFNVPRDLIETSSGRNTREELSNLAKLFEDRRENIRIGLITSAWHLPRAMRLAKKSNLKVEPIPADFRAEFPKRTILSFLPNSGALENNSLALKEYLARIAGQ